LNNAIFIDRVVRVTTSEAFLALENVCKYIYGVRKDYKSLKTMLSNLKKRVFKRKPKSVEVKRETDVQVKDHSDHSLKGYKNYLNEMRFQVWKKIVPTVLSSVRRLFNMKKKGYFL